MSECRCCAFRSVVVCNGLCRVISSKVYVSPVNEGDAGESVTIVGEKVL